MAQGRTEIKALLAEHDLRPRRNLGQNFLADPNLVDRIVRTAGVGAGSQVVEIGAGTGALTRSLAGTGARVVAYEVDTRLIPLLVDVLGDTDVELRAADAMAVSLSDDLGEGPWTMVANLPYNVGTPLVLDVLRSVSIVTRLVVMVQREVADRFVARPGSKAYGVPSIVVALHSRTELGFTVPPNVFYPAPDVESAVVVMERIDPPALAEEAVELAGVVFRQRRKMLRRSLLSVTDEPGRILETASIDETARPEDLYPESFVRLAEAMQ